MAAVQAIAGELAPHRAEILAPAGNSLGSNTSYSWCVRIDDNSHSGELVEGTHGPDDVHLPALGAGEYAFGHELSDGDDGEQRRHLAVFKYFSIDGDPIELTPSGHVEDVSVEDERVEARWTLWEDNETGGTGLYTVERVDGAESARSMIPEQIIRENDEPLRDALFLMDEHCVDAVHVRGRFNGSKPFNDEDYTLEYRGDYYRVESGYL